MATDQATTEAPPQMYLVRIVTPQGVEPLTGFDQRSKIAFKDGKAHIDDPEIVRYAKAQTHWETTKVGPATQTAQIEETPGSGGGTDPAPVSEDPMPADDDAVNAPAVKLPEGIETGKRVRFKTSKGHIEGTITKVNMASIVVDKDDGLTERVPHGKYELVNK